MGITDSIISYPQSFAESACPQSTCFPLTGSRTPHYGSQTPLHDGSRTPGQSGAWDPSNPNTPSRYLTHTHSHTHFKLCFCFDTFCFLSGTKRSTTSATMTSPPRPLRATEGPPTLRPRVTQKSRLHRSTLSTTLRLLEHLLCECPHGGAVLPHTHVFTQNSSSCLSQTSSLTRVNN